MNKTIDIYIQESGFKKSFIAEELGISSQTLTRRLNHTRKWRLPEVYKMARLLQIPLNDIEQVFDIDCGNQESVSIRNEKSHI